MSMSEPSPRELDSAAQVIALSHHHVLEIHHGAEDNILRILSPDGIAGLAITISARGITLNVTGGNLTLQTTGALAIDAEKLSLHGRVGVTVSSGGDASLQVAGEFNAEAHTQNIRARLGNLNLRANDDVCLDGEKIRLNSPCLRPQAPKSTTVERSSLSPDGEES